MNIIHRICHYLFGWDYMYVQGGFFGDVIRKIRVDCRGHKFVRVLGEGIESMAVDVYLIPSDSSVKTQDIDEDEYILYPLTWKGSSSRGEERLNPEYSDEYKLNKILKRKHDDETNTD